MPIDTATTSRTCGQCGKPLHGRSDMLYCNDTCRNTFNRKKRLEERICEHENTPEIIRIIKRNYELLKAANRKELLEGEEIHTSKENVENLDTRYYTSCFIDTNGSQWYCLFERCYQVHENKIWIRDVPEQAII